MSHLKKKKLIRLNIMSFAFFCYSINSTREIKEIVVSIKSDVHLP